VLFIPELGFDGMWDHWENQGQMDIRQKAKQKVNQLLESTPRDSQPQKTNDALSSIMSRAHEALVE
jgi:trimethylamine:corrinoid methyltransferase-like protein